MHTAKYQSTEFYHIAFCTSIREEEKFQFVCSRNSDLRALLEANQEYIRSYRNYLAHYNFVGGVEKQPEMKYAVPSR